MVVVNPTIRRIYMEGFPRPAGIVNEIVVHGTGGGQSAAGIIRWMEQGERAAQYRQGIALFHDLVDRDGTIHNIIDHARWVYHSGSGNHDRETIGIELVNPMAGNAGPYTDDQYDALGERILEIMETYPITAIAGHGYNQTKYSRKPKACPGEAFDWERLYDWLLDEGYVATLRGEYIFGIRRSAA